MFSRGRVLSAFLHKGVLEIFNFQLTGFLESHTLFLTPFIDKLKEINDCPKELRKTQTEKYNSLFEPNLLKTNLFYRIDQHRIKYQSDSWGQKTFHDLNFFSKFT